MSHSFLLLYVNKKPIATLAFYCRNVLNSDCSLISVPSGLQMAPSDLAHSPPPKPKMGLFFDYLHHHIL
jgi:hypothetical protein